MKTRDAWLFAALLLFWGLLPRAAQLCAQDKPPSGLDRYPDPLHAPPQIHEPAYERQSLQLLDGLQINLFAAEPMVQKPIQMAWDPEGRLWVCCSVTYPHIRPGEKPRDKIVVLEDTDGDGQADKSTVFADGLYVPTGFELGDGGVYVANPPDLLFLKDTDGDLRADVRKVVLTGFGTEDNHHCISAWRWGPGGWLYFQEGTFLHSQVETPWGVVRLRYGGVFQFRPRELKLRVFADYRASNPWGHAIDRWGQSILIDNPSLYFLAPLTANSRAKLAYEPSGRGIKQSGGEFISGRHFPERFRGELWTCRYKARQIPRYRVRDDGAGVVINEIEPAVSTENPYFRPVDIKMGPDGAVYITDWYNFLIGHMQHSFRDPRRDREHGRIWRITYAGRPLVPKPKLRGVPLPELLDHLKDPEDWTRYQVKRVLYEMDPAVVAEALEQWVQGLDADDPEFEHHRLEALWCFQTIGVPNPRLLGEVLQSRDPRARAAATRVLRYWHPEIHDAMSWLERLVEDPHPRVRMEAVLTLGYVMKPRSVVVALRALNHPTDRYIEHALKLTVDGLSKVWLPEYQAGRLRFEGREHREFAFANLVSSEAVEALIAAFNAGEIDVTRLRGALDALANRATARQVEPLLLQLAELVRDNIGIDPDSLLAVLDALEIAARERGITPDPRVARLIARCYRVQDRRVQIVVTRLVGAWRIESERKRLLNLVQDRRTPGELRVAAANALAAIGHREDLRLLNRWAEGDHIEDAYIAALSLVGVAPEKAAQATARVLQRRVTAALDLGALVLAFVRRQGGAEALLNALRQTPPARENAREVLQRLFETGVAPPALVDLFRSAAGSGALANKLSSLPPKQLAAVALERGDPERGEELFFRRDLACASCHGFAGAGPQIGPDLAAVGASMPPDYIVESILQPSKVIKEYYETGVVATTDGKVITGRVLFQGEDSITLIDPNRGPDPITIGKDRIEEFVISRASLMPDGLADRFLSEQEFYDIVAFLAATGKPGKFAPDSRPVARRWRLWKPPSELNADLVDNIRPPVDGRNWQRAYSTLRGYLVPGLSIEPGIVVARTEIDVARAGLVQLRSPEARGVLDVRVDGQSVGGRFPLTIRVARGRHAIDLILDTRRQSRIHLEFSATGEGAAVFQPVLGP